MAGDYINMQDADIRELFIPPFVQKCLYEVLPHSICLTRLIVKESARNCGIGTLAVEKVIEIAKKMGKREVILMVDPDSERKRDLIRWYTKLGFEMTSGGEIMRRRV